MSKDFNPNQVSFYQGAVRVEGVSRKLGLDHRKIMTSHDRHAGEIKKALNVSNVPEGFRKYQLPFVFDKSQFFVTEAPANAEIPEHSHDEGDGIRFVVGGSVVYNGVELKAGDWMYIPKGSRYSLKVGPNGASMCYCYCCCCAGAADVRDWIVDPAIHA